MSNSDWRGGPYTSNWASRLALPDPLWIVADDTLGELEWALRSEPLPHLAIGMGLTEELRTVQRPLTDHQLGKILRLDLESSAYGPSLLTYSNLTRSNYVQYAAQHQHGIGRIAE